MHDLDGGGGGGGGGGGDHFHDGGDLSGAVYNLDNVTLTTIGVDVGSSTYHLMFARVHLCRDAQQLSSRYEVVEREVLWRSQIGLTPYRRGCIVADTVGEFVAASHLAAGLTPEEVDSGAVILTGEALRQNNARALADAIAAGSGKFVCVSAGHHLESLLAAYGSGACEYSNQSGKRLLHIDIGGGTTKLALIENGEVRATAAVMVGGRQIAWNDRREIRSTTAGARTIARGAKVGVRPGTVLSAEDEERFVEAQTGVILAIASGQRDPFGRQLRLTRLLPQLFQPDAVSFSGGVSEYIYDRESGEYGDLGATLGRRLRVAIDSGEIPVEVADPGEGIRATVIGASQRSVQLSGNTVTVSDPEILPVHNVPVVHPEVPANEDADQAFDSDELAIAIKHAVTSYGLVPEDAVALAFSWRGDPSYHQLAAFAHGVQKGLAGASDAPAIVLLDDDVAASVGSLLSTEFPLERPLICLDGLALSPLDHVDVGTILEPSHALPVVIKSLLFG